MVNILGKVTVQGSGLRRKVKFDWTHKHNIEFEGKILNIIMLKCIKKRKFLKTK